MGSSKGGARLLPRPFEDYSLCRSYHPLSSPGSLLSQSHSQITVQLLEMSFLLVLVPPPSPSLF